MTNGLTKNQQIELIESLEQRIELDKREQLYRLYKKCYPWQRQFIASTKDHTFSMLMASNRSGKTRTGRIIGAYHLRGDYPDDWPGLTFDFPPLVWLLGYSGEKTRDLLQKSLFGLCVDRKFTGGLIPADRIIDYLPMTGTAQAMRQVRVKHVNGISTCQFWSYTQGQHAIMGDEVDYFQVDEEPQNPTIFPQLATRILSGNQGKGGSGILTFTPENGKTELVCKFMGEDIELADDDTSSGISDINNDGMYLQTATWDQCPHLDEDAKRKILSIYPPYQRDMRSKGIPLMGSGLIYEVDEKELSFQPFDYPDYWFVINAMDFGWDHPQAHIQMVWDRDADIFYLVNAWKKSKKHPYEAWHIIKRWADKVPTAWPGDGLQHKQQSSGESIKLKELYQAEGFNMLPERATHEDGGDGVWVGIMQLINLMQTGRFKIAAPLFEVFEELRQYHTKTVPAGRDDAGKSKIVKVKDDLLDAIRYGYMMRRYAIRICDLNPPEEVYRAHEQTGIDNEMGY